MNEVAIPGRTPAKRQRDEQVRRFCRKLRSLAPHLDNRTFGPQVQAYAKVTLLLARAYETLRTGELTNLDGEIKASVDVCRRLAETSSRLARELGITPATLRALSREKNVDLAASFVEHDD